jgi:hypothetical protein
MMAPAVLKGLSDATVCTQVTWVGTASIREEAVVQQAKAAYDNGDLWPTSTQHGVLSSNNTMEQRKQHMLAVLKRPTKAVAAEPEAHPSSTSSSTSSSSSNNIYPGRQCGAARWQQQAPTHHSVLPSMPIIHGRW